MIVYHEANPDAAESILRNGLKKTSRGDKGSSSDIARTDRYLDERLPERLREKGVSRDNNIYAFLCGDNTIISITDGAAIPLDDFILNSDQAVLRLTVDPKRCYVSDLELYDTVKAALESDDTGQAEASTGQYWEALSPLQDYQPNSFKRPEIMITYDIDSKNIELVTE